MRGFKSEDCGGLVVLVLVMRAGRGVLGAREVALSGEAFR